MNSIELLAELSGTSKSAFYSLLGVSILSRIRYVRAGDVILSTPFWEFPQVKCSNSNAVLVPHFLLPFGSFKLVA